MQKVIMGFSRGIVLSLMFVVAMLSSPAIHSADEDCQPNGEYGFVCGLQNAEDMVLVPDTRWIIASGMAPTAAIYLIDSQLKIWSELYPSDTPYARQDMATYGACPGSPDPNNFVTHGLNLRPGKEGHSTLYVVGHGEREAIEVFDVDASGATPELTWIGCVMTPDGMEANSVASFNDGSLVATIPLHTGKTISDAMAGQLTGAVYEWSPGDSGFSKIEGTELPYGNGVEVSADGEEIYVVSSGLFTFNVYSNSNPARQLRVSAPMSFVPDNLHWTDDGTLITAGLVAEYAPCDQPTESNDFDLAAFASCPRPFVVHAIDPQTMTGQDIARGPADARFSNITMALPAGKELWIGTFAGDRIAWRPL